VTKKKVPAPVSGSKKGAQKPPYEAPNSLKSMAVARIVDLISEGEIVGLVDGQKSVYLDETPVVNADGTANFQNIVLDWRYGTQTQDYLSGFPGVENELGISVQLQYGTPWVRNFTNININAVRVRLSTPTLVKTDTSTGDTTGTNVDYAIDVATDGGPYVTKVTSSFNGKCLSKYERDHRIDLPTATTGWNIRVRRLTADSSSGALQNTTFVESVVEVIDAKLRYPNSAVIGIQVDASQFTSIPSRAYDVKGRIIRVPMNYDPTTRAYATTGAGTTGGVWDGTFKLAWTDNPAWIYYDIVTHPRYGLGNLITDAQVNKWELYKIAQYCDQLVPDGKGGQEPRFACNMVLATQADAYKIIADLGTAFRAMSYWANGEIVAVADKPETVLYTYTPANVVDGNFLYQGSSQKQRYSVALVSWNDPSINYRTAVEYVDDQDAIAKYGIRQTDATAIACTSQGQAQRLGRYMLATSLYETQTVTFSVGLDGTLVAPGKLIAIADPLKAGFRSGGRVSSATTTTVVVDKLPDTGLAVGDSLTCIMSDGTAQTRVINAITTGTRTLQVSVAFSEAPAAESVWAVETVGVKLQTYRVLSVTEDDSGSSYVINAVQHNASKFDYVDLKTKIDVPNTVGVSFKTMTPPTGVGISSRQTIGQVVAATVLSIYWLPVDGAKGYDVEYQADNGEWTMLPRVTGQMAEVDNIRAGVYQARVTAISAAGVSSSPSYSTTLTVADQTAKPLTLQTVETNVATALTNAANAQAAADGAVVSFWQTSPPTIGSGAGQASVGDIWFDTDDGNKIYRVVSGSWVRADDDDMAQALAAASTAQSTADGKVKTYFQSSAPVGGLSLGDLWFNTTTSKLSRWNGVDWSSTVSDITADQLSGRGVNLLPDELSIPQDYLPSSTGQQGTLTRDNFSYFGFGSYRMISSGTDEYHAFDKAFTLQPGKKYLMSMYVYSSATNCICQTNFGSVDVPADTFFANFSTAATANTWTRVTAVIDLTAKTGTSWRFRLDNTATSGVTTYIDGIMLEEMVGTKTVPSAFVRSNMQNRISDGNYKNDAIGFVFRDAFDSANVLSRWVSYQGTGEMSITTDSGSNMGGSVMRVGNNAGDDLAWLINTTALSAFDATKLYRMRVRVRRNSGTGALYLGIAGIAADKTTLVNTAGGNSHVSQHYMVAAGATPTTGVWTEYVGYFKGYGTGINAPTTITNPSPLHSSVRYIAPLVLLNYGGVAGQMDVDYVIIEDADAISLANSKAATFAQSSAPVSGMNPGDTWFNTAELRTYYWTGTAWSLLADQTEATTTMYIMNPGFEQPLSVGWVDAWGSGISGWVTQNGGISGSRELTVTGSGTIRNTGIFQSGVGAKVLPVVAGQRTRSQITLKRNAAADGVVGFGLAYYDNGGSIISHPLADSDITAGSLTTGIWKTVTKYQTAPAGAVLARFCLSTTGQTSASGTWTFDNCYVDYQPSSLDEVPPSSTRTTVNPSQVQNGILPPYSYGDELILNGGFEQIRAGSMAISIPTSLGQIVCDGWQIKETPGGILSRAISSGIDVGPARTGSYNIFFGNFGGEVVPASADLYTIIAQTTSFPVTAGENFVVRAAVWAAYANAIPAGLTVTSFFGLRFFDAGGGYVGQSGIMRSESNSARTWPTTALTRIEDLSYAPTGAVYAIPYMYSQFLNNTGSAITLPYAVQHLRVDDFSVKRIASADTNQGGANLLGNTDFTSAVNTSGTPAGGYWYGLPGTKNSDQLGNYIGYNAGVNVISYLYQDCAAITPGEVYSASIDVQWAPNNGDGYARIYMEVFNGSGGLIASIVPPSDNIRAIRWTDGRYGGTVSTFRLELNGQRMPAGASFVRVVFQTYGGTAGTNGIALRHPKFERGIIATPYVGSGERVYGTEVTVKGSRRQLGGPRNMPSNQIMGAVSVRTATALSAASTGAVSINAHSIELNGETVTYSAVTNAVTGLTPGAAYVIYTIDPFADGGVRSWFAATTMLAAQQSSVGVVIGGTITIPTSGTSSGGGGGGGDPRDWCVDWDAVMADGQLARELLEGDMVECVDVTQEIPTVEMVTLEKIAFGEEESYTLVTEHGAQLTQSKSTPMDTRDGRIVTTPDMLDEYVLVKRPIGNCWERVIAVEPVGVRKVVKLSLGGRMFFAGDQKGVYIATHNVNAKP
jgi:predicted phage tail protein